MGGCPALADQVLDMGLQTEYIDQIATYRDFHRIVIYPQRFKWHSAKDLAFDLLLDDYNAMVPNRKALISGLYDQIGVSCGCHPTFEVWCVVELGYQVEGLEDNEQLKAWKAKQAGEEISGDLEALLPEIKSPSDATCKKEFTSRYC
jgi:hypothetical protein